VSDSAVQANALAVELSQYGEVEVVALTRLQKVTSEHLSHNWLTIPHVTHHDEADVTDLERMRASLRGSKPGKLTSLAFYIKAIANTLREFPRFNASIDADAGTLLLKRYCHIGIAVDTPRGLIVPVLRDCDKKNVLQIATEATECAERAREKGLPLSALVGGCFTISSLGKSGGLAFTPIINGREVAILGISRVVDAPIRDGESIAWRTKVPLSLSYDHRVINGMDAARFMTRLKDILSAPSVLAGEHFDS
jgi:pyruvate dehydrogenase E2 component (dihydrolipoamide acetyltransferase)